MSAVRTCAVQFCHKHQYQPRMRLVVYFEFCCSNAWVYKNWKVTTKPIQARDGNKWSGELNANKRKISKESPKQIGLLNGVCLGVVYAQTGGVNSANVTSVQLNQLSGARFREIVYVPENWPKKARRNKKRHRILERFGKWRRYKQQSRA